jgi:streptogramin lyase
MRNSFTLFLLFLIPVALLSQLPDYSWKFYTPGNTGIMGDYSEAVWIDHDGDPYIAAYIPGYEEGGFSKFIQAENRWINYSNIEYPVIGSIYDVGSSRISDIVEDSDGILWMSTWRGILKFDPATGGSSLEFWGADNSLHPGGRTKDIDIAPDGSVWAAVLSVTWGFGGLIHFDPVTDEWQYWGYGSTANNWPSLIGFCEHVSVQEKPAGGYTVWVDGQGWNTMITFDSDTQLFTLLPQNYETGEVVALPGNDCIDDDGNLWALRVTNPGDPFSLDYLTPAGIWITPQQPSSVMADIWAFTAFGNNEALITGLDSEIFQFDGTAWQSKGIWREGAYTSGLNIDDLGNIWVSGIGGAAKRDHQTGMWQRHRITNSSQIDYSVEDISIDDEGNVWMTGNAGPGAGGFQKFDGTRWTGFNEETYGLGYPFPFPTDNSEAICYRPSNGEVVVNPMYNYLHSWDGNDYTSLNYPLDRSRGLAEDSQGRLWSLGDYYNLSYYNDNNNAWTTVPFIGWGANIRTDPTRPGTVWACTGYQVLMTDGLYNYSKVLEDFQELDPQSDALATVIPASDGIAWVGSNQGLFRLDANNDTYEFFYPGNSLIPGENITPLAYTPDGRLWFTNFQSVNASEIGLCWFDGSEFGIFPVEDSGLPHAQISDVEIKEHLNGYELWISCISRGIAVLDVINDNVGIVSPGISQPVLFLQNYPNPFKDNTSISFTLPNSGHISLSIYDINGRIVRHLADRPYPSGTFSLSWSGEDSQGRRVSPGVYFCRLTAGDQSAAVRMIIH